MPNNNEALSEMHRLRCTNLKEQNEIIYIKKKILFKNKLLFNPCTKTNKISLGFR